MTFKFTINQLLVRFYYRVGKALSQRGAALMYYKLVQVLLQSEAAFLCYQAGQLVLLNRAGITKWTNFYYKVGGNYYKVASICVPVPREQLRIMVS